MTAVPKTTVESSESIITNEAKDARIAALDDEQKDRKAAAALAAAPATDYAHITEGRATILYPRAADEVFYNPIQEYNRDLSIAVIRQFAADRETECRSRYEKRVNAKPVVRGAKKERDNGKGKKRKRDGKTVEKQGEDVEKEVTDVQKEVTDAQKEATDAQREAVDIQKEGEDFQKDETIVESVNIEISSEQHEQQKQQQQQPRKLLYKPVPRLKILEALAASGLRSVRYALEMDDIVGTVTANDFSADAVASIRRNIEFNKVPAGRIVPSQADARMLMYQHSAEPRLFFDVVDLDPYGSASQFIDAAVQCLLCVTCTDMAVLGGGNYPETCWAKYGGTTVRAKYCHELGLRLLLHAISTSAARYRRHIVPILSCSIDFYVRVFVRVYESPLQCKAAVARTSILYDCVGCGTFATAPFGRLDALAHGNVKFAGSQPPPVGPRCPHCQSVFHMGGPVWSGQLHDQEFVGRLVESLRTEDAPKLYGTHSRMLGMMSMISEEIDTLFYYDYPSLFSVARATTPRLVEIHSAILNAGYRVSSTHCRDRGFKTDAPAAFLWDMVRAWVKRTEEETGIKKKDLPVGAPGFKILAAESTHEISFEQHADSNPGSRKDGLVRFADHKGMNWGPKTRAKMPKHRKDNGADSVDELVAK